MVRRLLVTQLKISGARNLSEFRNKSMYAIKNPESLILELRQVGNENSVFVIRHAERFPFTGLAVECHDAVSITQAGWQASYKFGREIQELGAIFSSPVLRCVQTADAIRVGGSSETIPRILSSLDLPRAADPAAHVRDLEKRGWDPCTHDWLLGSSGPGGLPPARSVAEQMLEELATAGINTAGPVIAVTHDINISALHRYLASGFETTCPFLGGIRMVFPSLL
jgi:broad specificity phosphatase PhoE